MLNKIKRCIADNDLLETNSTVIVGFSGGADSVALLYSLNNLGYNVLALHIEHGIRGEEAINDADFAENFCKKYNLKFFVEHINVPEFAEKNGFSYDFFRIFLFPIKKSAHNCPEQSYALVFFLPIFCCFCNDTSPELSVIIIPYGKTLVNASVKAPASTPV